MTTLRDQLKAGLSGSAHESGNEAGPSVSELAKKIKAIKAAHTIEATPQRIRKKHSSAEETITARIRRRHEVNPTPDQAVAPGAEPATEPAVSMEPSQDSSTRPPMTFQERLAIERQRKSDGPPSPA